MHNNNWKKDTYMTEKDHADLTAYRLDTQEKQFNELKTELKELKEIVLRLDKKLSGIPEGGLQCSIHSVRMDNVEKRLGVVEAKADTLSIFRTKSLVWGTVGIIILQLIIAAVVVPFGEKLINGNASVPPTTHLTVK
jgi:hypothetical protein